MSKKNKDIIILDCGTKVTPFNLKKALRGDDVVCRNGDTISQLIKFNLKSNINDSLMGVANKDDDLYSWNDLGQYSVSNSGWDLFMLYKEKTKKKKTKLWVNVYATVDCYYEVSNAFDSKKEAKNNAPDYAKEDVSYVGTVKIKF